MSTRLEEVLEQKRKRLKAKYLIKRALCQKWIAHCEFLMSRIIEWLQPLEDENYLEIQLETVSIWEDQFGEYEVPALRLVFFAKTDSRDQTGWIFRYRLSRPSRYDRGEYSSRNAVTQRKRRVGVCKARGEIRKTRAVVVQ